MATTERPKNHIRRIAIAAFCFSPFASLIVSIIAPFNGVEQTSFAGVGFALAALCIALTNFYLVFIRDRWLKWRYGTLEGIRNISVIPILGTILSALGVIFGFGAIGTAIIGIIALALDTGGAPWILVSTWNEPGIWDAE